MRVCKVKDCGEKYRTNGYCDKHYSQIKKQGKILTRTRSCGNGHNCCGDYYEVCLYNIKQEEVGRALVDKDDYDKVKNIKWHLANGYVESGKPKVKLHQFISGKKEGFVIDHINHNKLDNRKQNLRHCTKSQNGMNRKSKGCYFKKELNKWVALIRLNNRSIHLGYFEEKNKAVKVRREAEQKYFGEFAYRQKSRENN